MQAVFVHDDRIEAILEFGRKEHRAVQCRCDDSVLRPLHAAALLALGKFVLSSVPMYSVSVVRHCTGGIQGAADGVYRRADRMRGTSPQNVSKNSAVALRIL